jgi:hypothetical protein
VCFSLTILWQFAELEPKISWPITFFLLLCVKESLKVWIHKIKTFIEKRACGRIFFVRGRIFRLIWQNTFAKSWQHCIYCISRLCFCELFGQLALTEKKVSVVVISIFTFQCQAEQMTALCFGKKKNWGTRV